MKSALANIGEMELSAAAAKLEQAGHDKKIDAIAAETPSFLTELQTFVEKLTLSAPSSPISSSPHTLDSTHFPCEAYSEMQKKLLLIIRACDSYDRHTIKKMIAELKRKTWPLQIEKHLSNMSINLLDGDFECVKRIAEELNKMISTP